MTDAEQQISNNPEELRNDIKLSVEKSGVYNIAFLYTDPDPDTGIHRRVSKRYYIETEGEHGLVLRAVEPQ